MRVGIDARAAVRYRGTGLGTYTARLIEALAEVDQLNEYCAFLPSALGTGEERGEPFNVPAQGNFRSYTFPASPDRAAEDLAISRGLAEGDYDLHHVPHNGLGYPPEPPCPVVTTVHDLIPYVLPQTCTRRYLERFLARMPEICARSSLILTVSRRTRADLCQILGLPAQKIVVVYEAPEPCYQPGSFVEASARMSERYGLPSPYLLYVGGFSPRKHLTALLTAYAKVYRDLPGEPALVLAGSPDPAAQRLVDRARDLGLQDKVLFPGFVPLADLPDLYRAARFFVYPSLYEGFGLPPLEAMASGTPVVVSQESSLPEVVGDAGLLIDPYDPESLAGGLLRLGTDQELWEILRQRGLRRAKDFSWKRTACETLLAYEAIGEC